MRHDKPALLVIAGAALLLTACGGGYSGSSSGANTGSNGSKVASEQDLFTQRVQGQLDNCRTCHVPGGVADTDKGRRMMLSSNKAEDYQNFKASWSTLGGGVEQNRILLKASNTDPEAHTGGTPWPKDGDAYNNVKALFGCWDNPGNCAAILAALGGGVVTELPLLGDIDATGGRNYAAQFCEGKTDSTPLPQDPRLLISGDNLGNPNYAVWYNAPFAECETDTLFETQARQNELLKAKGMKPVYSAKPRPKTCGEWKAAVDRGREYITRNALTGAALTPNSFINLAKYLGVGIPDGLEARRQWLRNGGQEQVNKLALQRYGSPPAPHRNPAPLPGEDPNATNGGSLLLPIGFAQTKDDNGHWTGGIGVTCMGCHIGQIGTGEVIGNSAHRDGHPEIYGGTPEGLFYSSNGANTDTGLVYWELDQANGRLSKDSFNFQLAFPGYMSSRSRGTNAADQEIFNVLLGRDIDTLDWRSPLGIPVGNPTLNPLAKLVPSIPLAGGDQDMPTWWWTHNKTRYLWTGLGSAGSWRGNFFPSSTNVYDGYWSKAREGDYEDLDTWLNAAEAPKFVGPPVNTALAEQGAILFHSKDLWAGGGNADIPRPPVGNGSCASCHGAYSPRYAAQPGFLPDERLKGYSGLVVPVSIIGTDGAGTAYVGSYFPTPDYGTSGNEQLRNVASNVWFSFPDSMPGYRLPEEKPPFVEAFDDVRPPDGEASACALGPPTLGYTAQPLHGVWASGPYFHNGSVPTVWDVLKPADRPKVWLRQQVPESEASVLGDRGFDSNLSRAYDYDKLGWKYQSLDCQDVPFYRYLSCYGDSAPTATIGDLLLPGKVVEDYYAMPSKENAVDERAIYNTHAYSRGNQGHEFTKVLTDAERRALIEYLKTL